MTDVETPADRAEARNDARARAVFAGLVPSPQPVMAPAEPLPRDGGRLSRGVFVTMPIVLAGAMTVSMNLTGSIEPAAAQSKRPKPPTSQTPQAPVTTVASVTTAAVSAPATYRVKAGDTVSGIAERYGLSTASVLTLNGLGWKSLIFPGQVLKLTKPAAKPSPSTPPATGNRHYTVRSGDTISAIAARHGVSTQSVLDANRLGWSTIIYPGQKIVIPGTRPAPKPDPAPESKPAPDPKPGDGTPAPPPPPATSGPVTYTVRSGDTISGIAARHDVSTQSVLDANGLGWSSIIYPGQKIVIPGAQGGDEPTIDPDPVSSVTPATYYYIVVSGDTISGIAKKHGVSTQSVLDANGLGWSSIIHPGKRIVIPGITTPAGGSSVTALTAEMATNARTIIDVGRSLGVSDRGIVIALAAAMQESSLRNIPYGDRDSVGLFQQRPSAGWGSVDQLMDPVHSARLFYGGPSNPNKGKTRGLLEIPGWQGMTVTQAAQAVQISAYPNAYAKWEASAWAWLAQLG